MFAALAVVAAAALLAGFATSMSMLVAASNFLLVYVFWEAVGACSYLLIGFWFHKPEAAAAAKKAFITTRIGDLGFLLGLLWLQDATGTLLLHDGTRHWCHSAALIRILGALGWPWRAAWLAWLIPAPLRDGLYRLLARNRYRLFGCSAQCLLPSTEHASRFLD